MRRTVFILLVGALFSMTSSAQGPGRGTGSRGPRGRGAGAADSTAATLSQLMKAIFYPSSNVIFASQSRNPAEVAPAKDASSATDPLQSSYGKWEAVENSALAIAEGSRLLMAPGRNCSNGVAVPVMNADWPNFVRELRAAAMTTYKAAQSKDQDKMVDAADTLTIACTNCHEKYREKTNSVDRCK